MRKIENKKHNAFVKNGVNKHKATSVAPLNLLKPFKSDLSNSLAEKQSALEETLRSTLGEPYYSTNGFILYNTDLIPSLDAIKGTDLKFDLTLTSPPYNIGKEYEDIVSVEDYVQWCKEWMELIYDCTADQGAFWLNLGYLEVPEKGLCVPIPYLLWNLSSFYLLQEVIWSYGAGVATKKRLSPRNEKWLFYIKDKSKYTFNLDDIRDPNVKYPNQKKNGKYRCNPLGKNPSDVWDFPKVTTGKKRSSKERTNHPAQFPLGVVERIILASSNPTDVILDPFAGSCSCGLAAAGLGRIFVGTELNEDYCSMAIDRHKAFLEARKEYKKENAMLFFEE